MTTVTGEDTAGEGGSFARDWQALRGDGDIQFVPLTRPPTPEPPRWWLDLLEFLGRVFGPMAEFFGAIGTAIGVSGQVLMWGVVALAAICAILLALRFLRRTRARGDEGAEDNGWTPDARMARALLEDADRLAAEGRYGEAAHLLLVRSVEEIAAARPGLLDPSTTAREIATLPGLPDNARHAFSTISARVERSLFALRALSVEDWQAARAAYSEFAAAIPAGT